MMEDLSIWQTCKDLTSKHFKENAKTRPYLHATNEDTDKDEKQDTKHEMTHEHSRHKYDMKHTRVTCKPHQI